MIRLAAIGLVWIGCLVAWMILGSSLVVRSDASSGALRKEVTLLWGPELAQKPPTAAWTEARTVAPATRKAPAQTAETRVPLPLERSEIAVALDLEQRRKGLLWFPTYAVEFQSDDTFRNPSASARPVELVFPLEKATGVFDDFRVTNPQGAPVAVEFQDGAAVWKDEFAAGESRQYRVHYRSRGTSAWHYHMTDGTGQVRGFHLAMRTDFPNVDFPAGSMSPTRHATRGQGWEGEWTFASLVANAPIGVKMPERLNPGPLASKITFFAPIGLLFFFFVVSVFAIGGRQELHPMHYLMLGCAFFSFHLLFAYLVDHLPIAVSFAIAAAVSIFLVVSYARLFTGWSFALREMGVSQLLFLVLFSVTFFWPGYTGLAITIGAILTLFVMMQITGRTRWEERLPSRPAQAGGHVSR